MTMKKTIVAGCLAGWVLTFAALPGAQVQAQGDDAPPVNLILKNDSGSSVDVSLVDQYGGNFTATIDGGTSQNQTLQPQSEIKIGESVVHVVAPADEGQEIVIAAP